jgi:hypothetical protein
MATTKNFINRKKITRRKPGTKPAGDYFSKDTQKAILEYQKEVSLPEKHKIYVEKILPAFESLVENLINVYGFKVMYETKKDLKSECCAFLFSTVHKFDGEKGSKAFSYFNVVGKHWLTIRSKQNAKKVKAYISLDDREALTNSDLEHLELHNFVPSYETVMEQNETLKNLHRVVDTLEKRVKTDNEKLCVGAIQEIVNNMGDIDLLSKRAILCYLREISGLSAKSLSVVLSNLKKHYKEIKKEIVNE